jgi:hypothetical protein
MIKLTKHQIKKIILQPIIQSTEEELKSFAAILGLRFKDYTTTNLGDQTYFEIHCKNTYVIAVRADKTKVVGFSNENINFDEGSSGVSIAGLKTLKDVILVVFNLFFHKLHIEYEGVIWDEDGFYSQQELEDILDFINPILFDKKYMENAD